MKNTVQKKALLSIVLCSILLLSCSSDPKNESETASNTDTLVEPKRETEAVTNTRTTLVIKNNSNEDINTYVILAALGGACDSGCPPITADQLDSLGFCEQVINPKGSSYAGKCQLVLGASESKTFPNIPNTCISGNVTFGNYPQCPTATYPYGFTTAEFTLNPPSGNKEAIDISMVNGLNSQITMYTSASGGWESGTENTSVDSISPNYVVDFSDPEKVWEGINTNNIGKYGVYPVNCTDCQSLVGTTVCGDFPNPPVCQANAICNVQRNVSELGDTVTIVYNGPAPLMAE